jgi:hypothetical protein
MLIPSTLDDTLAPPGQHVASLFCQHVAPQLPDGSSWDDHREEVADLMIDRSNSHAPGFKASVLGRQIMSPLDLERTFGLIGGDIFHGALSLNQLFSARPMLGHADYRGPLPGSLHVRLRAPIPAAASPAPPATTRRAPACQIGKRRIAPPNTTRRVERRRLRTRTPNSPFPACRHASRRRAASCCPERCNPSSAPTWWTLSPPPPRYW